MASFHRRPATGTGAEVTTLTGGLATNQIPTTSVATLLGDNPTALAEALQRPAPSTPSATVATSPSMPR